MCLFFDEICVMIEISYRKKGYIMIYGKISDKQKQILKCIRDTTLSKGYPPTVREICEAVNLKSTSSVHAHLAALENAGYIRRDGNKTRAIEVINNTETSTSQETSSEAVMVPVIGNVAAGMPVLAVENILDHLPLPVHRLPNTECFFLKVNGESMINAGILDGDYLIVAKQNTALNGEIVVAMVDDSATVKTFYKENGHIRLQPENDFMDPIIVDDCTIIGKMIGVLRFV